MGYVEGAYGRQLARVIAAFCRKHLDELRAGQSFRELAKKENRSEQ